MPLTLIILLLIGLLILIFYVQMYHKRKALPPGPTPLPLIGNLLELAQSGAGRENLFMQWRHKYGPIYTFWLGPTPVVSIADYRKMVETFQKDGDNFGARPENFVMAPTFTKNGLNANGILMSNGDEWREQRRFALQVLRDLGLGKNRLEQHILQEIGWLFQRIDMKLANGGNLQNAGVELDLLSLIELSIGSIINTLVFGHAFEGPNESEYWALKESLNLSTWNDPRAKLLEVFPQLRHIPPLRQFVAKLTAQLDPIIEYAKKIVIPRIIAQKMAKGGIGRRRRTKGLFGCFSSGNGKKEKAIEKNGGHHYFSIHQIFSMCIELWMAGQVGASMIIAWGFAHLLHHPEYLKRLQEELDEEIGSPERIITMADRTKLPYTNAVVHEFICVNSQVLSNVPHAITKYTQLGGFTLPKGTWVVAQLSAMFSDDALFPEAVRFNPDHHLDEQGRFRRRDEFIPFGIGKRQCPGESLARMELFLLTANILNRYKIFPTGKELPSLKCCSAFDHFNKCTPFMCGMQKR